jgi:hypothetical protein
VDGCTEGGSRTGRPKGTSRRELRDEQAGIRTLLAGAVGQAAARSVRETAGRVGCAAHAQATRLAGANVRSSTAFPSRSGRAAVRGARARPRVAAAASAGGAYLPDGRAVRARRTRESAGRVKGAGLTGPGGITATVARPALRAGAAAAAAPGAPGPRAAAGPRAPAGPRVATTGGPAAPGGISSAPARAARSTCATCDCDARKPQECRGESHSSSKDWLVAPGTHNQASQPRLVCTHTAPDSHAMVPPLGRVDESQAPDYTDVPPREGGGIGRRTSLRC